MSCPSCGRELPRLVPVLPLLRGAGRSRGRSPGGAQGRHRPLRRPRRLHRPRRVARPRGRAGPPRARTTRELRSELERFGGTVEKFIGDAVVALFGAPVAHEDDPERAVRAALAIRDWVVEQGEELQARIAVNTGEALVSLDARPSEGEGMAAGDVVNTAARLQSGAPVNGILVGEQTYRATSQAIAYREAEPVVGRARASRSPPGRRSRPDRASASTSRVARTRSSSAALVSSTCSSRRSSGCGKSARRSCSRSWAYRESARAGSCASCSAVVERDAELVRWRQGRSLPYGEGVTFWALGEIVKAQAGILENDTPAAGGEARRTVERVAEEAERRGSSVTCDRSPASAEADSAAPRRASPPGAAFSRRSPRSGRSCSSSRTCTGPTTRCSTSSTQLVERVGAGPAARRRHRPPGAARSGDRAGAGQAERPHDLAFAAFRRGHRAARRRAARAAAARRRDAGSAARAIRRQPALRGAVRPHPARAG